MAQLMAQVSPVDTVEQDTSGGGKVTIIIADEAYYIEEDDRTIQKLKAVIQQVELQQGNTFMYCDSATIIDNNVTAMGNVIIQQGDSVSVFSDSLYYEANTRIADLFGNVALQKGNQKLFTDQLRYHVKDRIASYYNWARINNDTTFLTSKRGFFYLKRNEAFFKDSVMVKEENFLLLSDTLQYNTKTSVATFLGPTRIKQDSADIYCEDGFYNSRTKTAQFSENAQYEKGDQKATGNLITYDGEKKVVEIQGKAYFAEGEKKARADTIRYEENIEVTSLTGNALFIDGEKEVEGPSIRYDKVKDAFSTTGRSMISDPPKLLEADTIDYLSDAGYARGNVVWRDTAEQITVWCGRANYFEADDYLKAFDERPLMMSIMEEDTMFMRSDTLVSALDTLSADSARIMLAYHRVRMFKRDLQATCDSMVYSSSDSIFILYDDPLLWSDTTQFSGDTVKMELRDGTINRVLINNNGFINNTTDELLFNQVKGRQVVAYFFEKQLERMHVSGNAEAVYYLQDEEDAYIGVNKTACSEMMMYFGDNKVEKITFYQRPSGKFIPAEDANHEALKLQGFRWEKNSRPKGVDDL
jgi:lipopolysaccharide export system protein LptA